MASNVFFQVFFAFNFNSFIQLSTLYFSVMQYSIFRYLFNLNIWLAIASNLLWVTMFCYCIGTARGCGWQKIGAYVNLGSYYLVGIPSAILLAFVFHKGGQVTLSCHIFNIPNVCYKKKKKRQQKNYKKADFFFNDIKNVSSRVFGWESYVLWLSKFYPYLSLRFELIGRKK